MQLEAGSWKLTGPLEGKWTYLTVEAEKLRGRAAPNDVRFGHNKKGTISQQDPGPPR